MKFILVDTNTDLIREWNNAFKDVMDQHEITIVHGSIFTQPVNAIVSPGNSFGYMDGGLDYYITKLLGSDIQAKLQEHIKINTIGELLVGQAVLIETSHDTISHVVCAPTMRVPMPLGATSVNVYLAAKAIFSLMLNHRHLTVAIPGLGTGAGRVPVEMCAKQMRQALDDVMHSYYPPGWRLASIHHNSLMS